MSPAAPVISVRGLRKRYGAIRAVDGVDLTIAPGQVYALLGPNGAGKTTTVEILEGFRRPDAGEARVLGMDPGTGSLAYRARIGIAFQNSATQELLSPREILRFQAALYPSPMPPDEALALAGLTEAADQRAGKLSGGQRRRLDLAAAVVGRPEVIFLDEPTTGFDPAARRQAWDVVRGLTSQGRTVLLTTHYLDEAEALADRIGIIARGRIIAEGTMDELRRHFGARTQIRWRHDADRMPPPASLPGAWADGASREATGQVTLATPAPYRDLRALLDWAAAAGLDDLPELTVTRSTLEELYLELLAEERS
jgi:ABC-2 type transport system ATP-binding protein